MFGEVANNRSDPGASGSEAQSIKTARTTDTEIGVHYLGGRWYTFDARHNHPRIGRVVIARGRDAADVAISATFGPAQLVRFTVITEEVQESNHCSIQEGVMLRPIDLRERRQFA
jgi:hypothetical protein